MQMGTLSVPIHYYFANTASSIVSLLNLPFSFVSVVVSSWNVFTVFARVVFLTIPRVSFGLQDECQYLY